MVRLCLYLVGNTISRIGLEVAKEPARVADYPKAPLGGKGGHFSHHALSHLTGKVTVKGPAA